MARPLRIQRLAASLGWLSRKVLSGASGGRNALEQRKAFVKYHEAPLREEARLERILDRVVSGAVLGSEQFVAEVKAVWKRGSSEELRSGEFFGEKIAWRSIVHAVEAVHGGRCEEFKDCYYGD